MQELRLVAVSEDGSYAVLVVPGRSGRFALPIDDRLRTVARGQFSRLAQFEIEVESPLRPKEIQDRIRAGETAEEIADAAGLPVDRIRRFEGPVLAEREFRATEAQRATVRGRNDSGPGPRLGDVVAARLAEVGASTDDVEWDSRKRQDGSWQVQVAYTVAGRMHMAEWIYDPRSKHVTPDDDEAMRLCLDEADWPGPRPAATTVVTATVTPIGSRVGTAGGSGGSPPRVSTPGGSGGSPPRVSTVSPRADSAAAHQDQRAEADRPGSRISAHASRQGPAPAMPAKGQVLASGRDLSAGQAGVHGSADQDGPDPARGTDPQEDRGHLPATPAEEQGPPGRPARRASSSRSRRSSVPSWDEIMLGNSRQPD